MVSSIRIFQRIRISSVLRPFLQRPLTRLRSTIILGLVYDFGVSSFEVEKGSISTISGVKSVLPMVSCSANFV